MARGHGQTSTHDRDTSAEDLGEDVLALAVAASVRGRASVVRRVDGVLLRLIVEVA
jgi:hypothetical protein